MTCYLAGKIAGNDNFKENFSEGMRQLQQQGFTVLSPVVLPEGMTIRAYMRICFAMIDCADVVAFLPNWAESRGALLENSYCQYISKQTYYLPEGDAFHAIRTQ